jgi:hypothetical protein
MHRSTGPESGPRLCCWAPCRCTPVLTNLECTGVLGLNLVPGCVAGHHVGVLQSRVLKFSVEVILVSQLVGFSTKNINKQAEFIKLNNIFVISLTFHIPFFLLTSFCMQNSN